MITGNIEGVRKRILEELEAIFDIKTEKYSFVSNEIIEVMTRATEELNREISVLIDRKGKVLEVTIGDSSTVSMPLVDLRDNKLSRVRVVHTHPNGNPKSVSTRYLSFGKNETRCNYSHWCERNP